MDTNSKRIYVKCSNCQVVLPLSDFGLDRKSKLGVQSNCKPCTRKKSKEQVLRDVTGLASLLAEARYLQRPVDVMDPRFDMQWSRTQTRVRVMSKRTGKATDLQRTDLIGLFHPTCPASGVELSFRSHEGVRPNQFSIDRIDSKGTYEPANIWVISRRSNSAKGTRDSAALFTHAAEVRQGKKSSLCSDEIETLAFALAKQEARCRT